MKKYQMQKSAGRTSRRGFNALFVVLQGCAFLAVIGASGIANAQACPRAEQPILSLRLEQLLREGKPDDAMQCIIELAEKEKEQADGYPDEVRYQLAKQASDAIEALGGDATVIRSYHFQASDLWKKYLLKVSTPVDRSRVPFGITKLLQHGRYASFPDYIPVLAKAFAQGKSWVTPSQANQLFSTAKRCPTWANTTYLGPIRCSKPCPEVGQSLLSALDEAFGSESWHGSEGVKTLSVNAQALRKSLICHMP